MNLSKILAEEFSKAHVLRVARLVNDAPGLFAELWRQVIAQEGRSSRLAVWALEIVVENQPELLIPYLQEISDFLPLAKHTAYHRHLTKVLAYYVAEIPEPLQGPLYAWSLEQLDSALAPAAVRVHAMELAARIARPYPELQRELATVIRAHLSLGSAGFQSRGKKVLKRLGL
jgi:hypothetical protein